jgi:hypothetical protein
MGLTIEGYTRILSTVRCCWQDGSVCEASSRFALVRGLIKRNPSVGTDFQPRSQLGCVGKIGRSQHHLSTVGETEESWAGEMWAIAGKQSRLTSDVATSAVLMWVEG